MEICSNNKSEYDKGTIKLRPNVKADISFVEADVLGCVEADDRHHMILVLNYCATAIGKKHKDIKTCIYPTRHRETGEMLLYTVFVGLPLSTVIEDEHACYIRAISPGRIDKNITYEVDQKASPMMWRMAIVINASKNLSEFEEMSIVNIHLRKKYRVNVVYDKEADDDQRGSTKRSRHNNNNEYDK